ncbi:MAG: DUF1566 domain-containing protein [Sulfurovum sp.]
MKKVIFIMLIVNVLFGSRFTKDGDIITDKITLLQWQDSPVTKVVKSIEGAKKRCEEFRLGGFKDWRLPKKEDILSVVNYSKKNDPKLLRDVNKETNSYDWTPEKRSYMTHYAWFVYFNYGYSDYFFKYYSNFIRCVRGGKKLEEKKKPYSKYRRN